MFAEERGDSLRQLELGFSGDGGFAVLDEQMVEAERRAHGDGDPAIFRR